MNKNSVKLTNFQKMVYNIIRQIPKGKVLTYKEVARLIGSPRAHRAVGNALNKNQFKEVPCHRVIRSDGQIGGYTRGNLEKIKILRKEGLKLNIKNQISKL